MVKGHFWQFIYIKPMSLCSGTTFDLRFEPYIAKHCYVGLTSQRFAESGGRPFFSCKITRNKL